MFEHPSKTAIEDERETMIFESEDISEIKSYEASFKNYEWRVKSVLKAHDALYDKHLDLQSRYNEQSREIGELKVQFDIVMANQ